VLADAAESAEQPDHHIVAGEPVVDPFACAAALDERGAAEKLQMPGRVGNSEARACGQILDAALALPEMFEQFEPMRVRKRVGDLRKTRKNLLFWTHA